MYTRPVITDGSGIYDSVYSNNYVDPESSTQNRTAPHIQSGAVLAQVQRFNDLGEGHGYRNPGFTAESLADPPSSSQTAAGTRSVPDTHSHISDSGSYLTPIDSATSPHRFPDYLSLRSSGYEVPVSGSDPGIDYEGYTEVRY